MTLPLEVMPIEVKGRLDAGDSVVLIDVREPDEFASARIADAELIPMRTIPAQLQKLEALADNATLVVLCHHGMRSMQVTQWLRQNGIESCQSMAGGIDLWSATVDPAVPRY